MSISKKLRLPKEHGAWAMLYVPFALGTIVAARVSWQWLFLLLAVSALFISRESMLIWWRAKSRGRDAKGADRTLFIYLAIAAICGAPLILFFKLYGLIPLALFGMVLLVVNGKQAVNLEERSILGEILAICGLTMTAPAAYYVSSGEWNHTALWLWLLCGFYFSSSVFYIKVRVAGLHRNKPNVLHRVLQHCAFYHTFLIVALVLFTFTKNLELPILIAFTPAISRAFIGMLTPGRKVNLTQAGFLEVVYSLIFLIFTTLTFS